MPRYGPARGRRFLAGLAVVVLAGSAVTATAADGPGQAGPKPGRRAPAAYLIYLLDGRDPLVVRRYVEEGNEIRFEKYGGWVGIPKYEVVRIVPDDPDALPLFPSVRPAPTPAPAAAPPAAALPPAPGPPPSAAPSPSEGPPPPVTLDETPAEGPPAEEPPLPAREEGTLYVTLQSGGQMKADAVTAEGDRLRIDVPDGSFTVPRAELVGIVRVSSRAGLAEAWLTLSSLVERNPAGQAAAIEPPRPAGASPDPAGGASGPGAGRPRSPLPGLASDRPHLLRLAGGQVLRIDGFWVEGGEVRFRRFGGLVGVALAEVLRLIPDELAPAQARTAVHYVQQLGPDVVEVRVKGELRPVRLIGVEPIPEARPPDTPWTRLRPGFVLDLEFDRQRTGPGGEWLAYAFLPDGKMLNGELIRLGLARPRSDGQNLRYLDLFEELAGPAPGPRASVDP